MLRPDPAQRPRLVGLRDNLHDRIAEATDHGWLGDVEGLTISLTAANDKLADLDKLATRQSTVHLGMPGLDSLAGHGVTETTPS